jgi:enoyl-CoA hydratase/carnithine racemase
MSDITSETGSGILRVELNRPTRKNAMTNDMYTALADLFRRADADDAVQVVLISGAGKDFTAGNDVGAFLEGSPGTGESPQATLMAALVAFGKPIVAAVRGVAIGGGTTMLTHFDFVYAADSARFQVPFINLALVPEFGSSYSLPARVGHLRAAELFMLGEPFTAAHAAELGLVTRVVPDADVLATAVATAEKLVAKPSGALRAMKRLMKQASLGPVRQAIEAENEEFGARLRSAESKEALSAFLEKRPPRFANPTPPPAAA